MYGWYTALLLHVLLTVYRIFYMHAHTCTSGLLSLVFNTTTPYPLLTASLMYGSCVPSSSELFIISLQYIHIHVVWSGHYITAF